MYRRVDSEKIVLPSDKKEGGYLMTPVVNAGFHYVEHGKKVEFIDDTGKNYCGLLDMEGKPLGGDQPPVFLWFAKEKIT